MLKLVTMSIKISINPLAEFLDATPKRRERIIEEQKNPNSLKLPYYHKVRGSIIRSIKNGMEESIIDDAIDELKNRVTKKGHWKDHDKVNSIAALNKWKDQMIPDDLYGAGLEVIKVKQKDLVIYGVSIKVSPNLIFRIKENGANRIGAIKLHVSKNKQFSVKQSSMVAQVINQYLSNVVAEEDDIVDPKLCLCIDPFAGTTVSAFDKINFEMKVLKEICKEIPGIWDGASQSGKQQRNTA